MSHIFDTYLYGMSVHETSISCIYMYCSEFMKSLSIKEPPELRRKMELFTAEQRTLNKKRLDLLESLRFVEAESRFLLLYARAY